MLRSRPARRLVVAVLFLLVVDAFVPSALRRLEDARYEDVVQDFRFENSDLFGVGPLLAYLAERPSGRQPRVMFLGNSVIYGYGLSAAEAVPGQYQRLHRSEKVFNAGVNGFDPASIYLVAKAAIAAIDRIYVLSRTYDPGIPTMVGRRVPIDDEDARRFGVAMPDATEEYLQRVADQWALYRHSYRLQAALLGTSARQYLYLHKGTFARRLFATLTARTIAAQTDTEVLATAPLATEMPGPERLHAVRSASSDLLWSFGELARSQGKTLVILQVPGFSEWLPDANAVADFNRVFFPFARVVLLSVPAAQMSDGMHLTAAGAAALALALSRERAVYESLPR